MLRQKNKSLSIAIAEKLDRVGKKLAVTGNGRCNITNLNISKSNYYGHSKDAAFEILSDFSFEDTKSFFSSIGIEFAAENNKVFPLSLQANSVVDVLRFYASLNNIELLTNFKIKSVKKGGNLFIAKCEEGAELSAKTVVIATGGLAGGSKLGCDGEGYQILKTFGHKIFDQTPTIVQVKTDNTLTKQLKGIKVEAAVSVKDKTKTLAKDFGEVLFTDYGLSGPPILQISRYCTKGKYISLDLLPKYSENQISDLLLKRKNIFKDLPLSEFFAGLINKKLGQVILKSCNINQNLLTNDLNKENINSISEKLKNFCFDTLGNTGFTNAQATSGGADLNDFSNQLMSKKVSGLFAVGEVLDVDGDCGGYNLQWSWSSAAAVCNGILKFLETF
jgi:predicted Rossmann fold flavoprotein